MENITTPDKTIHIASKGTYLTVFNDALKTINDRQFQNIFYFSAIFWRFYTEYDTNTVHKDTSLQDKY